MSDVSSLFPNILNDLGTRSLENHAQPKQQLGQNEFFQLMIAQLKHQDPLKPTENDALIAQVAQFSTVDGIHEMQRSIEALAGSFQSAQALQASTLVGRDVLVSTDRGVLEPGQPISGAVRLDASASALSIDVTTPAGALVRTIELGPQVSGRIDFSWDGFDNRGQPVPTGQYIIQARAVREGETSNVATLIQSKVESVTLNREPGMLTLNLRHQQPVLLNQIAELL